PQFLVRSTHSLMISSLKDRFAESLKSNEEQGRRLEHAQKVIAYLRKSLAEGEASQEKLRGTVRKVQMEHERTLLLLSSREEELERLKMRLVFLEQELKSKLDMDLMRLALEQSRKDLSAVGTELSKLKADFSDVVPRIQFDALELRANRQAEELAEATDALNKNRKHLKVVSEERDFLRDENVKLRADNLDLRRTATPRPNWQICAEHFPKGSAKWKSQTKLKTSREKLQILLEGFLGRRLDLDDGPAEYFQGKKKQRNL
ncbi:unnamed protein product, partial [Cyprideis torosa]